MEYFVPHRPPSRNVTWTDKYRNVLPRPAYQKSSRQFPTDPPAGVSFFSRTGTPPSNHSRHQYNLPRSPRHQPYPEIHVRDKKFVPREYLFPTGSPHYAPCLPGKCGLPRFQLVFPSTDSGKPQNVLSRLVHSRK